MAALTLPCNHCRDLNHRIDVGLGENSLSSCALDVETEDPQWRDLQPVTIRRVRDEVFVTNDQQD